MFNLNVSVSELQAEGRNYTGQYTKHFWSGLLGLLPGLYEKLPIYGNVENKGKREADGGIGKSRPKASKCLHYSLQITVE